MDLERSRQKYNHKKGKGDNAIKGLDDSLRIFDSQLTAGDVMSSLHEKFQSGFHYKDANSFLFSNYGASSKDGNLYKRLAEIGFLSREGTCVYEFSANYVAEHCKAKESVLETKAAESVPGWNKLVEESNRILGK